MRFKRPELSDEFAFDIHPELRAALTDFNAWCAEVELPEPLITDLGRTWTQNQRVGGAKRSFHLSGSAADLSVSLYDETQKAIVVSWFKKRCPFPAWEFIHVPHGTGPHLHLARADRTWREREAENV